MPYKNIEDKRAQSRKYYKKYKNTLRFRNPDGSPKLRGLQRTDPDKYREKSRQNYWNNLERNRETAHCREARNKFYSNCPICNTFTIMCYEHDHISGEFRGYICKLCNLALGHVKDNIETLENMIQYLEKDNAI